MRCNCLLLRWWRLLELQRSAVKLTSAFTEQCVLKLTPPREGKCISLINVVKLANNRWAWGRCLERWWSYKHKGRACRVTIATQWGATTGDLSLKNSGTMILTSYLPQRGWEGRELICRACSKTGTAHVRMSWPQQQSCKACLQPGRLLTSIVSDLTSRKLRLTTF